MPPKKHRKLESSDESNNSDSYQEEHQPGVKKGPSTLKSQRARRTNLNIKNYQQEYDESEDKAPSQPEQYVFYAGGRVSKVLAQRYRSGTNVIERLCKFHLKSYLHVEWITDQQAITRNIYMNHSYLRTQKKKEMLQSIQSKFGKEHFFPPAYTRVDRILTRAVLFPLMHHKKGSEMNGKWSEMMMLVCSKLLNFVKNNIPYGVCEKDDYYPESVDQMHGNNKKTKIEHAINRVYLDKYQSPEQFWKDVGESVNSLTKLVHQTGREQDAQILKECAIFLYWQWFRLSKQRFLTFLPKQAQYQKIRKDLQQERCQVDFNFAQNEQKFNLESQMLNENIFIRQNYGQIPTTQKQLLLLHPGRFSYSWIETTNETDFRRTNFKHLNLNDIKNLDLNVEIDHLYLIKWCDLDYDQVTWQKESDLNCTDKLLNFKQYSKIPPKKDRQRIQQNKKYQKAILNQMTNLPSKEKESPETIEKYRRKLYHYDHSSKDKIQQYGGQNIPIYKDYKILKNFQLEGLNWLIRCWHENRNCILADEMGLGKTIQTIAFLNHLMIFQNVLGPFLVVAPVSTLKQWRNQIEQWSDLNCVLYKGRKDARDLIQQYQFYHRFVTNEGIFVKFQKLPRFQVLLINYDIFVSDIEMFQKLAFQHIIIDEAHKMKNSNTKIAQTLKKLPCSRILLLTGTPIQNNTSELFGLLSIIQPKTFNSLERFKQKFGDLKTAESLTELKKVLKPYLMRRVKSDVQKSIPSLTQMLVNLELTKIQKVFYRSILQQNKSKLLSLSKVSIGNISMCLRQCCNHPYMLSQEVEEQITSGCTTDEEKFDKFIKSSSKMIFIHKFLTKCREKGTKTLIFTQFINMISLLQHYCSNMGIKYEFLNGSINYGQRQNRIDRFNNEKDVLVFIISTKAGGVGINLTSATNIIIYDTDWNPQNDIQAIGRAHRIGQQKSVTVYRLITTHTYEDVLYKSSIKKLGIGLAILDNEYFNNQEVSATSRKNQKSKEQIEKLLRDGVLTFLKSEQTNKQEKTSIQNESIQDIITKSCTSVDFQTKNCSFTTAKFKHDIEGEADGKIISTDDPNFWQVALENVESPLQKLVKKLKQEINCRKIFESPQLQLSLMMEANEVVYNFVKSKVSMSHYNAQDQRQLRKFLQKITQSRQFQKKYKNIANDWLQEIEKPSRRFQKFDFSTIADIQVNTKETVERISRSKSKTMSDEQQISNQSPPRKRITKGKGKQQKIEEKESSSWIEQIQENEEKAQNTKEDKKPLDPVQLRKLVNENLQLFLEKICCFCERKLCSKICQGLCKRNFHSVCYKRYKQKDSSVPIIFQIEQLKMSKEELCDSLSAPFQCFECQLGEAKCFLCGMTGEVVPSQWVSCHPRLKVRFSDDPNSTNQIDGIYQKASKQQKSAVFMCRMEYCTNAYHLKCLKQTKNELQFQIYGNQSSNKSYPLKCPCHFCCFCHKNLSLKQSSCLRCPVSYHKKCKDQSKLAVYDIDTNHFVCNIHMDEQQIEMKKQQNRFDTKGSKKQRKNHKKEEKQIDSVKEKHQSKIPDSQNMMAKMQNAFKEATETIQKEKSI